MVNNENAKFGSGIVKWIMVCFAVMVMCCSTGVVANAQTVEEQDDNDSMESAQYISANSETAAGCVNGTYSGQYVVNGYTSNTDEDWYKVYLSAGTQYVTCNGGSYNFVVYDADETEVYSNTFTNTGVGMKAYDFPVSSSAYYYVRVSGLTSSAVNYKLLVGGTTYSVSDYTYSFGSVSMTGSDVKKSVPTSSDSTIPEDAIAYTITISNVSSTATNGVTVVNSGKTLSLSASNLSKSGLVSYNMSMAKSWTLTFKYKKTTTIKPKVTIYYVYPVKSGLVQ